MRAVTDAEALFACAVLATLLLVAALLAEE